MVVRFNDIDELKRNTSPEFVAKNAAQLGIDPTPDGEMRINQGGRFSHAVRDILNNQPKQNKYHNRRLIAMAFFMIAKKKLRRPLSWSC